LMVDISGSMSIPLEDFNGSRRTRLHAVLDAVETFAEALCPLRDVVCTLSLFNDECRTPIAQEPAADGRFLTRVRQLRGAVSAKGGGRYLEALKTLREHCAAGAVNIGILLSDGVSTEELSGEGRGGILASLGDIRLEFGDRFKLHTVGVGKFDGTCLRALASAGHGEFHENMDMNPGQLRGTFMQLFSAVSTLRTTVLAYGAEALVPLPPREMEEQECWRGASAEQRAAMAEDFWAWLMLGDDDSAAARNKDSGTLQSEIMDLKPRGEAQQVSLHKKPFAAGGLRYAYHLFLATPGQKGQQKQMHLVVKESKFKSKHSTPQEVHRYFLSNHRRAEVLAKKFNSACKGIIPAADGHDAIVARTLIKFVPAFVIKIADASTDSGFRFVIAERYIPGIYVKFNSNEGFVNQLADEEVSQIAAAFSHFSFDSTGGEEMCVDIQGVGLNWTDPQLHSRNQSFGHADLGKDGMQMFFANHTCGALCASLGLRHVFADSLTFGDPMKRVLARKLEKRFCMICMEAERHYVCRPCGHLCNCVDCKDVTRPCPVCRQHVHDLSKINMELPPSTFVPHLATPVRRAAAAAAVAAAVAVGPIARQAVANAWPAASMLPPPVPPPRLRSFNAARPAERLVPAPPQRLVRVNPNWGM